MSYFVNLLSARLYCLLVLSGVFFPLTLRAQTPTPLPVIPGVSSTVGNITSVAGSHSLGGNPVPVLATQAKFSSPSGLAFDAAGNLYIADTSGSGFSGRVYVVNATSGILSLFAGGASGSSAPNGSAAVGSWMSGASSLVFDSAGNLFIAASADSVIDEVPAGTAQLQLYAGQFQLAGSSGDSGAALSAKLAHPISLAIDTSNNLYVADSTNHSIRMIASGGGNISTVAGTTGTSCSTEASCGDGGPAAAAKMSFPDGVFVDVNKNILVVDKTLASVRVVYNGGAAMACLIALENPTSFTLSGGATSCSGATPPVPSPVPTVGNIYLLAGANGGCAKMPCGDGGLASKGQFYTPPGGIAVDGDGNIFVDDAYDALVRRIDAQTGLISSAIGSDANTTFKTGFSGDGGPATSALIGSAATNSINGLTTDTHGNLFLADTGNYNVRAVAGIAAIALTPQTITFSSLPNAAYGVAPITLSATANSNLPVSYSVTGPATVSGSTLTITGAGTVAVTASQTGDATHSAATPVTQSFTVSPATLKVTATSISQPQGTALPNPLPYAITGLVGSDTTTGTPVLTTTYTTSSPVGASYPINIAQGTLAIAPTSSVANYTFAFVNGTLTVGGATPQTLTFPALPATIAYGSSPIPLAATASSGLPITYTATGSAVVAGSATSGWTLSILTAGQGTVTASQGGNTQYAVATPQTQVFTVKQAALTVTATSFSQTYGTALPSPLPYTVAGLVGSDSVGGAPSLVTAYTPADTPGTVDQIAISPGTLTVQPPALPGNYSLALVPGTITVTKGANVITGLTIPTGNQSYGSVVTLNAKSSSGLPITYSVTGNATISGSTLTITGLGPITVTASQPGSTNYSAAASASVNFTATQATLTVTVGYYTRSQGATDPVFSATITGFVNGDANTPLVLTGAPIITTTATPASPPGTYPITPALGTLFSNNYKFAFVPGVLTVLQAPSYIVTASPNALTIPLGQSRQTTLSVQSTNSYQGSVTFSCGQIPLGVTCTFSPATVNIVANPAQTSPTNISTLTISTTGPSAALRTLHSEGPLMAGIFLVPGGIAGLLLAFQRKRISGNVRLRQLLVVLILFSGAMSMAACGSSNNNSVATLGSSTLLITSTGAGTSGTGSQNQTNILSLTVNVVPLNQQTQ